MRPAGAGTGEASDWKQARPDLVCTLNQIQSLPQKAKRNIAMLDDMLGSDQLEALAEFYQTEILPLAKNESIGAAGAAATAFDTRLSEFAKAAAKVRESLEKVRKGAKDKLPRHKMMLIEDNARALNKDFNSKFGAELNKITQRVKNRKGTVFTNAQRGIDVAKSAKTIKPIQFTSASAFKNIRAFEAVANGIGTTIIVLDAGFRVNKVHNDYLTGNNWH